jgi:hypothetical protein
MGTAILASAPSITLAEEPAWQAELRDWLSNNQADAATLGPKILALDDPGWKQAHDILDLSPSGAPPVNIAEYFLSDVPTKWVSAWPDAYANPIVVLFFSATHDKPAGDVTPWCAAFMNWCLNAVRKASNTSGGFPEFFWVWDRCLAEIRRWASR